MNALIFNNKTSVGLLEKKHKDYKKKYETITWFDN